MPASGTQGGHNYQYLSMSIPIRGDWKCESGKCGSEQSAPDYPLHTAQMENRRQASMDSQQSYNKTCLLRSNNVNLKQVVKVISHKTASPQQTDNKIVFAWWRQCAHMGGHIGATWRIRLNLCFLRPTRLHNPDGKSIGLAVSAPGTTRVICDIMTIPRRKS